MCRLTKIEGCLALITTTPYLVTFHTIKHLEEYERLLYEQYPLPWSFVGRITRVIGRI